MLAHFAANANINYGNYQGLCHESSGSGLVFAARGILLRKNPESRT